MGLQCREHVAHPSARGVELVDENHVRDLVAAEKAQERAHRHRPLDLGLAHDDDGVGHQHRLLRLIKQLDVARAVEDRPGIVEEGRAGDVDLGRHLARPSLGGVIADRIAFAHAAMPPDRAARKQHRFEQARLARQIRADKSNAAGGTRHRFLHKIRSWPPGPGGPLAGIGSWRGLFTEAIGISDPAERLRLQIERSNSPSPRPSPRKRGEGELRHRPDFRRQMPVSVK